MSEYAQTSPFGYSHNPYFYNILKNIYLKSHLNQILSYFPLNYGASRKIVSIGANYSEIRKILEFK